MKIQKWDEINGTGSSEDRMEAFLTSKTDTYAILQLSYDQPEVTAYERFESLNGLARQGKQPNIDHYEVVYTAPLLPYEAEITLMPTENTMIDRTLARELKKNPFMTKESVGEHYRKQLKKYLDDEFDYYCNCEEYYQPCVEDFMTDRDPVGTWCEENGFKLVACEGDGYDDGYEPKLWNGGW